MEICFLVMWRSFPYQICSWQCCLKTKANTCSLTSPDHSYVMGVKKKIKRTEFLFTQIMNVLVLIDKMKNAGFSSQEKRLCSLAETIAFGSFCIHRIFRLTSCFELPLKTFFQAQPIELLPLAFTVLYNQDLLLLPYTSVLPK